MNALPPYDQTISLDLAEALDSPDIAERDKKKILVVTMQRNGTSCDFITSCLGISASSVTRYLAEFREGGIAALVENRYYQPSRSLEPFWQCIGCSFKAAPAAAAKSAAERIQSRPPAPARFLQRRAAALSPGSRGRQRARLFRRCRALRARGVPGNGVVLRPPVYQDLPRQAALQRPRSLGQPQQRAHQRAHGRRHKLLEPVRALLRDPQKTPGN